MLKSKRKQIPEIEQMGLTLWLTWAKMTVLAQELILEPTIKVGGESWLCQ